MVFAGRNGSPLALKRPMNVENTPVSNWKKIIYGDGTQLGGYGMQGGGHIPVLQGDDIMKFFGLI